MAYPRCRRFAGAILLALLAIVAGSSAVQAQQELLGQKASPSSEPVVSLSANFTSPDTNHVAALYVRAKIKPGWHVYSITQKKGGPIPTSISVDMTRKFVPLGGIKSWPKATTTTDEAWPGLAIETHEGEVTWYAPIGFPEGVDPKDAKIDGVVTVQACDAEHCLPPKKFKFTATLGKAPELPAEAEPVSPLQPRRPEAAASPANVTGETEYRARGSHTTLRGHVEPAGKAAGGMIKVVLTADPAPPYHVYALESKDEGKGAYKPTLIRLELPVGWQASEPSPSGPPLEKQGDPIGGLVEIQQYYEQPVSWTIEVKIPPSAEAGQYPIAGLISYQSCSDQTCDPPTAARFDATITVDSSGRSAQLPLSFVRAKYNEPPRTTSKGVAIAGPVEPRPSAGVDDLDLNFQLVVAGDTELAQMPVWWVIALAFAGGALLNLMPCVLPVIGLKILAFVEQSGHHRARVLALNLWYALGLISVFMVLATLAVVWGFGWGELFQYQQFSIVMAAVVFAMSLSFLGVWEIPIPGFIGSGKTGELAAREGAIGAFSKGVVTTVLATPCTGPFLTSAFVWAAARPAPLVYTVFFSIGLGMASPYLLIGAFPRLIRWLPKPGAWMETFKQLMGFVLLATLVYLMNSLPSRSVIPTLALLFGIWAGCWWIGRHQWSTGGRSKLLAWLQAAAVATAVGVFAFTSLVPTEDITWQPFSLRQFKQAVHEDKTVVVDFTAPWCLNCKVLERTVLNTEPVREWVLENKVVALQAQWLDQYPETGLMLEKLNSEQIPVVAIFPAGDWTHPIVLRGLFGREKFLAALKQAGPSRSESVAVSAPAGMP